MIAGAFTSHHNNGNQPVSNVPVDQVLGQLCADDFTPLVSIPHDSRQLYQDDRVRLIQQSVTNTQPQSMAKCKRSGQVCISWSRLDNSDQLKKQLRLEPASAINDATIILASYQRWAEECPKQIRGDFVFAIYDPKRCLLLLARDRMGARPLYYSDISSCFIFASNAAAIAKLDGLTNQVSSSWVAQHIFRHYTDSSSTAFANIKKLPAGHTLVLSDKSGVSQPLIKAYWQIETLITNPSRRTDRSDIVDVYSRCFDQAVAKRSESNFPLGIELSGGLDSSSIMASMMEQGVDSNVHCFSRAYFSLEAGPLGELNKRYPHINKHLWSDPETSHEGYQTDLISYIELFGLPDEHSLAIGCTNFLRVANQHNVRTLLSGYGGDEFSSAYAHDVKRQLFNQRRFLALYVRLNGNPTARLRQLYRLAFRKPTIPIYKPPMLRSSHSDIVEVQQRQREYYGMLSSTSDHNSRIIQQWQHTGALRLESHALAGAAMGVAFHWPFLDEALLACYLGSPATERLGAGGQTRWLHRRAFSGRLPSIIVDKNDKNIGPLVNGSDPHEVFMRRFSGPIDLHSQLQTMVDVDELNQFLCAPTEEQKLMPVYRYTAKTIYSINLWLQTYF